jgi:hypothetical protein
MHRINRLNSTLSISAVLGLFGALLCSNAAIAQALPTATEQEVLIKGTLLTFNDANLTGNYTVMNSKLSKPFRDQFPADKLKETFKDFSDKQINFDVIAAKPPIPEGDAKIDGEGTLGLNGHFDTTPKKVKYHLDFIRSEGEWKPVGINVDVE